jgi:NAD(P)-dependent dehydrogenase (short-subunit alcohol dehydrogenase family)
MSVDDLLESSVVGSFSRFGYRWRSRAWDTTLPRLEGRVAVVSGATSGIGLETARQLAALGARTLLIGRNQERLDHAVAEIEADSTGDVFGLRADLSSVAAVTDLAANIIDTEPRVDILVNNASVLPAEKTMTDEGIELTLATNLIATFVLTNRLIPRMIESAPGRIITVSSGGMYTVPLDVNGFETNAEEFSGATMYARTKRAQVVLTEMWAEQLAGTGVVAHAMHPGWVDTPGLKMSLPRFHTITRPFLRSVPEGADTIVYLAADESVAETSGQFWHDRAPRRTHRSEKTRTSEEEKDRLWAYLCGLSGDPGTRSRTCAEPQ